MKSLILSPSTAVCGELIDLLWYGAALFDGENNTAADQHNAVADAIVDYIGDDLENAIPPAQVKICRAQISTIAPRN